MSMARLIAGFVLAPLPALALAAVIAREAGLLLELMTIGYGATLAGGIPVHLILRMRGKQGFARYLGATAYAVLLAAFLVAASNTLLSRPAEDNPFRLAMWSMPGVISVLFVAFLACFTAAVFWCVALRRRSP